MHWSASVCFSPTQTPATRTTTPKTTRLDKIKNLHAKVRSGPVG